MKPRVNIEDWRIAAQKALPRFVFDYVDGSADDSNCFNRNRSDLDAITLMPRMLRDTSKIDTSVEIFGKTWQQPFAIAPTGLNGLLRPQGDAMLASVAAAAGIPFVLSTASNMLLEEVRKAAPQAVQWMQLYVMHRGIAEHIVQRAADAAYQALVLTVDAPVSGNRERDAHNGFQMHLKPTPQLIWDLLTHPAWSLRMARAGVDFPNIVELGQKAVSASAQAALIKRAMDRTLVWESLSWLRTLWKGPLLIKGLLHPDDARLAIDHGADGIIVSNHGGRQLDAAPSAIAALPGVVDAVRGQVPVFMDSGVRRGSDVAKALALGAKAVFIARPTLYGLAAGGQVGAAAVLQLLVEDVERTMVLLGVRSVAELNRSLLAS